MKKIAFCSLILFSIGCRENYESPVKSIATGYLVMEGVVNSGTGPANITLSRTVPLDKRNKVFEAGAKVRLEGENNSSYTFVEKGNGVYGADNLNLNTSVRYRLRITAKTGKEYLSDFATVKNNPPIDSISLKRENGNGLQIYINTHDPQNNTRYYQWTYDETWQIQSAFPAVLKYKIVSSPTGPVYSVVYRDSSTFSADLTVYNCWQFFSSNTISLGSTVKLNKDIVNLPLIFIPRGAIKLGVLYSVVIRQYTWDKAGYEFLDRMKKNTEATGSIFDAQPSEIKGNIHCVTDSTEPVIGYFNICPQQQTRFFIKNSDVPGWGYNSGCSDVEIMNTSKAIFETGLGFFPTVVSQSSAGGAILAFMAAPPECVDCTLRGTNVKPAFWP